MRRFQGTCLLEMDWMLRLQNAGPGYGVRPVPRLLRPVILDGRQQDLLEPIMLKNTFTVR